MPIYEYSCSDCGALFEEWQKASDTSIDTCQQCGGRHVERIVSRTSFQLKGKGWAKDLYSK